MTLENIYIGTKVQIQKKFDIFYDDENNAIEELKLKYIKEFDEQGREITLTSYKANGTVINNTKRFYDVRGLEIKNTSYYTDSSAIYHIIFTHNEFDQILEKKYITSQGKCFSREVHKYDELGNRLRFRRYRRGKLVFEIITNYDIRGREMENISFENGSKLKSSNIILYDNANRVMENIHYDKNEIITYREVHFYNKSEKLKKTVCYDSVGKMIGESLYEYPTSGGEMVQRTDYEQKEKQQSFYDKNGNRYKYRNYYVNVLRIKILADFDKNARIIEERYYDFVVENGEVREYLSERISYEYIDY